MKKFLLWRLTYLSINKKGSLWKVPYMKITLRKTVNREAGQSSNRNLAILILTKIRNTQNTWNVLKCAESLFCLEVSFSVFCSVSEAGPSCVDQAGLELTEICLLSEGIKGMSMPPCPSTMLVCLLPPVKWTLRWTQEPTQELVSVLKLEDSL